MFKMFGQEEVVEVLLQMEKLVIDCDFCGQYYEFDVVDCVQLFVVDVGGVSEVSDVWY